MRLNDFSGGLNRRPDPHLIQPNQGRVYININDSKGSLTPVKDKSPTPAFASPTPWVYYFEAEGRWVQSDEQASWVEFQERMYWTDDTGNAYRDWNGQTYQLGLDKPEGNVTITFLYPSVDEVEFQGLGNVSISGVITSYGNLDTDTRYYYKLKNLYVTRQPVSGPFDFYLAEHIPMSGSEVPLPYGAVRLEAQDVADMAPETEVYRLYAGVYRYVGSITPTTPDIVDNQKNISTGKTLVEGSNLGRLNGTYTYAITYYSEHDGIESAPLLLEEAVIQNNDVTFQNLPVSNDPQVTHKRLYRIGGTLTAFSMVTQLPNSVTSFTDNIRDTEIDGRILVSQSNDPAPAGLKYLTESYAMLFGAVEDKLYFTPIGIPTSWPASFYLDFPTRITGIGETSVGLVVCTLNKTYLVTGSGPSSLSQQLLDGSEGCINHYTMQNLLGTAMWTSRNGVCASNGGQVINVTRSKLDRVTFNATSAVVYDQTYWLQETNSATFAADSDAATVKYFDLGVSHIVHGNGKLYGYTEGAFYELFAAPSNLPMQFYSADFAVGGLTQWKTFKSFYLWVDGKITLSVFIDEDEFISSKEIEGHGPVEIKIPNNSNSTMMSFAIEGTGRVLEVYWKDTSANA